MANERHPPRSAPPGPVNPRARRRRIALYIAIAVACLIAFWALAAFLVANNWLAPFDQSVNAFVRSIRAPWLNTAMWLASLPGDPPVIAPMTIIVALILAMWGWRSGAVLLVAAMAGEAVVQRFVSISFARIRPPLKFALIKPPVTLSFPSGHAWATLLLTALLGLILWRTISRRWPVRSMILAAVVALTLIVGASRVYLGVHWPTDVVGGWILAVFSLVLAGALYLWLVKRFEIKELMPPLGTLSMRVALTALGVALVLALLVYDASLNPLLGRALK
jgi:undecaprenyl-diphosphatase